MNTIVLCYYHIMSGGNTSEAGNNAGVDWRVVVLLGMQSARRSFSRL